MLAALCTTAFAAGTPEYSKVNVSAMDGSITYDEDYAWVTPVDSKNYTRLIKVSNANKKPSVYIFPNPYQEYDASAENESGKWMKITMEIAPKTDLTNVKVSPMITNWGYMSDEKALGNMSAGKSYLIDVVFNQADKKMYVYRDGACVANGDTYSTELIAAKVDKGCIYFTVDNNGYAEGTEITELKNVAISYYNNEQTLADFEAEEKEIRDNIEKETKVDKQTFSTVPSNGKKLDDGSYESTYTNPYNATTNPERDTFSLGESVKFDQSDAVVKTSFVRWHMDAEVKTYEGGVIEIEPVKNAKSFGRIVISADSKKHSIDILSDISAKKSYLYVDNAFAASGDLPDVESIGSVILKVTMPKDKKMVVDYSNVYYELYYDNPTEHKLEDIQKTIDTGSVTVTGVCVYNSGENKLAIWVGYAGVDTDKYNGYIAEYDANGMLVDARELGPWVDINSKTENAKVFIWEKSTNKPIISAVSSMKCDNEVVK